MTITVNVKTQKGDNAIKHGSYHSINGGRATCSELLLILGVQAQANMFSIDHAGLSQIGSHKNGMGK